MSQPSNFDWHNGVRELSRRSLVEGRLADLPPHVRQRILAVIDPDELVLGYVEVELDGNRSATGTAVFVTAIAVVSMTLDGVPHDGVGTPVDVEVRFVADVVGVAVTGYNDDWAPDQWREAPTGQYRLTFSNGGTLLLPPRRGPVTADLRAFILKLGRR